MLDWRGDRLRHASSRASKIGFKEIKIFQESATKMELIEADDPEWSGNP
jgi:hypothetical protein